MTSFNREMYISNAIESVLNQNFYDFEFIIVDDHSTDSTFQIINSYTLKDSRIKAFQNKTNLGQFKNRNYAASLAKADYLLFVDSDDTILPWSLSYIFENINSTENVEFATIYEGFEKLDKQVLSCKEIIYKHFFLNSILHIGPGGTVISRRLFHQIGGFNEKYGVAADNYYNIMAAIHSRTLLFYKNFLNYRLHPGQEKNNTLSYLYNGYLYFNDILTNPKMPLSMSEIQYLKMKSKRRFLVNSFRYLFNNKDLKGFRYSFSHTGFTVKDVFHAIFQ